MNKHQNEELDIEKIKEEISKEKEKPSLSKNQMKKKKEKINKYTRVGSLIGFFIIWEIISQINVIEEWFNPVFLPSPTMIIKTAYEYIQAGTLFGHIGISFFRLIIGFIIGTIIAIIMAIWMTKSKLIDNMISPIINLFGPIPVLAFLPMFLIWFGIGEGSKITLIAYTTFIAMLPYVRDGINNTDPILIRSAISLGATDFQVFRKVIFKSAMPNIFSGMKACLGLAFSSLVVAEMMGADSGLGFIIVDSKNWFKMSDMFMAAILIGLEYTVMYSILVSIEKVLFKWKRAGVESAVED